MKSFSEILTESKKTYPFKIGVAGEVPEGFEAHLKTMLEKFKVSSMSSASTKPIQERPLDFPNLQNIEVRYYDVEVHYPTTPQVLAEYISTCSMINASHVVVRNPNEPLEAYQEAKEDAVYEPLLTKEDMGGASAQVDVGGNRVMDLLKELEVARKERGLDPAAAAPVGESSDIADSENSKSTIGS
jgi:hypothetical protein